MSVRVRVCLHSNGSPVSRNRIFFSSWSMPAFPPWCTFDDTGVLHFGDVCRMQWSFVATHHRHSGGCFIIVQLCERRTTSDACVAFAMNLSMCTVLHSTWMRKPHLLGGKVINCSKCVQGSKSGRPRCPSHNLLSSYYSLFVFCHI